MTDKQWVENAPLYLGMSTRQWNKRELTNAVLYLVDSGCNWRQLPHDFPSYSTVHSFYCRARFNGSLDKILENLVAKTRKNAGRKEAPSYTIIDSQSVKWSLPAKNEGLTEEKTNGQKRNIVVAVLGNILPVVVHAANIHDTKSGILTAKAAKKHYPSIQDSAQTLVIGALL